LSNPQIDKKETVRNNDLSRMLIFPTALPLNTLQGYLQLNEFLFPFAAVGIENILIIGGGASPFFGLNQFYYLSPRITPIHFNNIYLAGGIFFISAFEEDSSWNGFPFGFGIAYGLATYSDNNFSLTVGIGNQFESNSMAKKPFLIIGGEFSLSNNFKIISENWRLPETDCVLSMLGVRVIGKYFSGDFAIMKTLGDKNGKPAPWLSLTYNFDLLH
jgi:hypothetical protein